MKKHTLRIFMHGHPMTVDVEESPLGWRWWRWTEWGSQDWLPMVDHRVIPLVRGAHSWLCALEKGGFRAIGAFSLFPIIDQDTREAAAFAEQVIRTHEREPALL